MLKRWPSLFLTLIVLWGSAGVRAQTDAATAEALMRSSGMWQQMASIATQVRAGVLQAVAQAGARPSAAEVDRITSAVDTAYAADRLRATAQRAIERDLDPRHLPAIDQWYASPVGRAATQLEERASAEQVDPQVVVRDGAARLASMPADRRAMLEDLAVVTRSAEALTQITIDTTLAAQRGASSVRPDGPAPSAVELMSALESQRPQLLKAFAALSLASYAMAYETLPTADLAQYVAFLRSEAGQHLTDVGLKAMGASFVEASTEFGRRLPGTADKANA